MGQLGLHLRLTDQELAHIEALPNSRAIDEYITEELEEAKFNSGDVAETDRSWAYIHAAMMGADPDGPLERESSIISQPAKGFFGKLFAMGKQASESWRDTGRAKYVIIGNETLVANDDHFFGLTRKTDVGAVASALDDISSEELQRLVVQAHERFEAMGDAQECAEYADSWFSGLVEFYRKTAERNEHILFTVSF
ncbi:DUF1877 family protein [uncultured Erythrobacter sp.]|uniref:DUF1877 family protein n=1 Tax=uncultured Erythrobacter sp. TaxID=263913 RepID=UPI002604A32E|nr:DUF1877 family protein [uncultured Erythrobacter sp.]